MTAQRRAGGNVAESPHPKVNYEHWELEFLNRDVSGQACLLRDSKLLSVPPSIVRKHTLEFQQAIFKKTACITVMVPKEALELHHGRFQKTALYLELLGLQKAAEAGAKGNLGQCSRHLSYFWNHCQHHKFVVSLKYKQQQ